jgi:hypothetical protein
MAELVDAADLKSVDRKVVRVQVPLRALCCYSDGNDYSTCNDRDSVLHSSRLVGVVATSQLKARMSQLQLSRTPPEPPPEPPNENPNEGRSGSGFRYSEEI